jgi:hypothetical protein
MASKPTTLERFWAKVNKDGPIPKHNPALGPCWIWTAARTGNGYGAYWLSGKLSSAHRISWFIGHGRWPEPNALHRCDNKSCVRLGHLFEGTAADNVHDMDAKGRHAAGERHGARLHPERLARGERHGCAKLTDSKVREARAKYASGGRIERLAKEYGVTRKAISNAVKGKTWRHIK